MSHMFDGDNVIFGLTNFDDGVCLMEVVLRRKIMNRQLSEFAGNMIAFWVASFVHGPMMFYANLLYVPVEEESGTADEAEVPQAPSRDRIYLV
ncbi:MAG: hypothetical protein WC724_01060 [Candidatus Paceibacterota bacterium]